MADRRTLSTIERAALDEQVREIYRYLPQFKPIAKTIPRQGVTDEFANPLYVIHINAEKPR